MYHTQNSAQSDALESKSFPPNLHSRTLTHTESPGLRSSTHEGNAYFKKQNDYIENYSHQRKFQKSSARGEDNGNEKLERQKEIGNFHAHCGAYSD
jgi:hypothetical protein